MRSLPLAAAALAYLAALGWLRPASEAFDGLAFVRAAAAGGIDYGHALYLPLLRLAGVGDDGVDPVGRAKWVSALGALLAVVLLGRAARVRGAAPLRAGLVAGWFGLGALLVHEAGSIEPTTWTLATLLLADAAAARHAQRPSAARLVTALLVYAAALGFHVVSLCALPWLARHAWPVRGSLPRAQAGIVLGAGLALLALALAGGELGRYARYWSGFLPSYSEGLASTLAAHAARGARLLGEGAPVLLAGGLVGAIALARARTAEWLEGALLAAPYLVAFLVLGKPLVGLLAPLPLAAGLVLARVAARWPGPRGTLALGLGLALTLAHALPQALAWSRAPDEPRARAALFARHVPAGSVLFSGPLANHFRFYHPELVVVALPELWHQAFARDRDAEPLAVVRAAVAAAQRPCVLTSEGAGFLVGDLGLAPEALGLAEEKTLFLPENPRLALFPLEPGASR
ncbi:MAG TPA: hypothetical protein VF530_23125 [Planctomycetota bacterium]